MKYLTSVHGKPTYRIKLLEDSDYSKLSIFCKECEQYGFINNKDFAAMKVDKIKMPYGQYYIAIDLATDKIFSVAGVHEFPEMGPNSYRCLFRGAQLPTYTPKWSMNMFNSGLHFSYFLYYQILLFPDSDLYITTNISTDSGARSSAIDRVMMPRMEKMGIWELYKSNITIFYTQQNVWKINKDRYLELRSEWIKNLPPEDAILYPGD